MPEHEKESEEIISETEDVIQDGDEHYIKVIHIKKKKTVTSETDLNPDDFIGAGAIRDLEITPEEKAGLAEALEESGLNKSAKVLKEVEFEEEKEHEMNEDEIIDHLMGKMYKEKSE